MKEPDGGTESMTGVILASLSLSLPTSGMRGRGGKFLHTGHKGERTAMTSKCYVNSRGLENYFQSHLYVHSVPQSIR